MVIQLWGLQPGGGKIHKHVGFCFKGLGMEELKNAAVVLFLVFVICGAAVGGEVLVVPEGYSTIKKAMLAAKHGDTIKLMGGVYDVQNLELKNGVSLRGVDSNSVLLRADADDSWVLMAEDCHEGTISGITFEHTPEEDGEEHEHYVPAVRLKSSSLKIFNCVVRNAEGPGIGIEGKGRSEIYDCVLENNTKSGILVRYEGAEPLLRNNRCLNNGGNGIYFVEGSGGTAKGNICSGNAYNGISVMNNWTSPKLLGNDCSENFGSGIYFGSESRGEADGNICKGNEWHGITVASDSSSPILKSNQCLNNKGCGIYYSDGATITAKGNVLRGNGEINYRQLRNMLQKKEFGELEETVSWLRTKKKLFSNSNSQLQWFYHSLADRWAGYSPSKEKWLFATLDSWIKEMPNSVTPLILKARAYKSFAWYARGNKWARETSDDSFDVFKEKLRKAWPILERVEKMDTKDPEIYRLFLGVGLGLGKSRDEMLGFFKKGVAVDSNYVPIYTQYAMTLMPRWGGRQGELEAFAERAAAMNEGVDGEILYAKIATSRVRVFLNSKPEDFLKFTFSYARIKQGHIELLNKYPESGCYLNSYSLFASIYRDRETAKKLFEQIGDGWDRWLWKKELHFNKYRSWAYGERELEAVKIADSNADRPSGNKIWGFLDALSSMFGR